MCIEIDNETRCKLQAAIKETEYKYFGYYELSDEQWDAVLDLIQFAEKALGNEK